MGNNIKNNIYNADATILKQNQILKSFIRISMQREESSVGCARMIDILKQEYDIDYCTLYLYRDTEELRAAYTDVDKYTEKELKRLVAEKISGLVDIKVFTTKDNHTLSYRSAAERKVRYAILLLLKTNKEKLGAILLEKVTADHTIELEEEAFKTIIETLTMSIENLLLHEKVRNMAIKDQLTQVHNRRYLYDEFVYEVAQEYSVAMIDIDFFKKVNDTYGHPAGDEVLKAVAKTLFYTIGSEGAVFRYGGEEFLVYIPKRIEESYEILEDARKSIQRITVPYEDERIKVTISVGLADTSFSDQFNPIRDYSDKALYTAKENGRNQVSIYDSTF